MSKHLLIFVCFTFLMCGQNQETKKTNPNWITLEKQNYSIQYPKDWSLNEEGVMGTAFFLFSPLESTNDNFRENVNLIIQDLSGQNIGLDKYVKVSEEQLKTMITNADLLESKRIKTANDEYHYIAFTGDQGIYKLKFIQQYWIKNQKAYVLTFSCENNKFKDYKKIGDEILQSFKLK